MQISVLNDVTIAKLHEASIEILATTGLQLPHNSALELFAEAGAEVDRAKQHVKIPESIVSHSLDVCGKEFTLYGRDRKKTAAFGVGKRNYTSNAGQAFWVNDDTHARRYASLADVTTAARYADALPWINMVGAMSDPHELPTSYRCVAVAAELIKNTTKPLNFWFYDRASAKFLLELFSLVGGGAGDTIPYPIGYPFLEPISPLRFPRDGIDVLLETCRMRLPVPIGPMAQVGSSAPGTLAGTLAQENAEILAGLCLVQLIQPGTPVCYGGIPHAFDMSTTQMIFAGPEQALMAVAMTQMGKHYGLPVYINTGLTDSKLADAQAGLEAGITLTCGAMAGADIFGHFGICGMDQGSSLSILTLQHEIISYVERMMRGIEINDECLGLDTIHDVGPGGSFLSEVHTAMHFRSELWFPEILDRNYFENWAAGGHKDLRERIGEKREALLDAHEVEPVSDDLGKEIDKIVSDAKRHLAPS